MSGAVATSLQQAIYTALAASSTLAALLAPHAFGGSPAVAAIYDRGPQPQEAEDPSSFPYLVIGDDTAIPFDTDDKDGQESTITIHIWSRYRGKAEVKRITDAIYDVLHNQALAISGQTHVFTYFEYSESFEDQDGLTLHGVARFRIVTMES